ncbi:MAG: hypothetical protein WBB69_16920 [Anaerolineales bacterium]
MFDLQLQALPHPSPGEIILTDATGDGSYERWLPGADEVIIPISPANEFAGWIPLTQYNQDKKILS